MDRLPEGRRVPDADRLPGGARRAIIGWINHYNAVRLHSSLGNIPPIEWELRFNQPGRLAA